MPSVSLSDTAFIPWVEDCLIGLWCALVGQLFEILFLASDENGYLCLFPKECLPEHLMRVAVADCKEEDDDGEI